MDRRPREARNPPYPDRPLMRDVTHVDWVVGRTLERITVVLKEGNIHHCLVRQLTGSEMDGGCDGCAKRHSPLNLMCSMTQGTPTWATEDVFYDLATQKVVKGVWRRIDQEWYKFNLGREVWVCESDKAPTRIGARLIR